MALFRQKRKINNLYVKDKVVDKEVLVDFLDNYNYLFNTTKFAVSCMIWMSIEKV